MARDSRGSAPRVARSPPVADYRHKTGKFQAKQGRAERTETAARAVARKQEPLPMRKVLLWLCVFGLFSGALYLYLAYVLADEDEELELAESA